MARPCHRRTSTSMSAMTNVSELAHGDGPPHVPSLLDVAGYEVLAPWVLDRLSWPPHAINIVGHDDRRRVLDAVADQSGAATITVDRPRQHPDRRRGSTRGLSAIAHAVGSHCRGARAPPRMKPPSPWAQPAAFRSWLADRYWTELHASRRDLWLRSLSRRVGGRAFRDVVPSRVPG